MLETLADAIGTPVSTIELVVGILVLLVILFGLYNMRRTVLLMGESPVGAVGAVLILVFVVLACLAPLLAPYDPNENLLRREVAGPFSYGTSVENVSRDVRKLMDADPSLDQEAAIAQIQRQFGFADMEVSEGRRLRVEGQKQLYFVLGTDQKGRDLLSRLMFGAQRVLIYATLATAAAYVVGIIFGLAAGYFRGWVDEAISFVANVILSFPVMVLYVLIITKLGASGTNIIIAVVFASSPGIMRIVRGLTLDLRTREYVAAAQTRGESSLWIMLIEILPNARGPLIVDGCLRMGYTTITIGALGFLGLGLPPPDPDWGGMITEGRSFAQQYPHIIVTPAVAVSLLVLGFNLLADGLREVSLRD